MEPGVQQRCADILVLGGPSRQRVILAAVSGGHLGSGPSWVTSHLGGEPSWQRAILVAGHLAILGASHLGGAIVSRAVGRAQP